VKLLGSCLLAATALAAVAAANASASEPSIWQCGAAKKEGKKYTGGYTEKKCATKSATKEGKYEFEEWNLGSKTEKTGKEGKVKEFKAKGAKGVGANLEIVGVGGLSCSKTAATGEFTGPKEAGKVVATFTGCELLHKSCKSLGSSAGEIKTLPLKAEIGYLGYLEPHLVGAAFFPESGSYLAEMECGEELEFRVSGSVVGEVETGAKSPYNKFSKELTVKFEQSAGHQKCKEKECVLLEGVPGEHKLLTEASKFGTHNFAEAFPSAEEDIVEAKGEELYLKA
jgi:hypothetical protein